MYLSVCVSLIAIKFSFVADKVLLCLVMCVCVGGSMSCGVPFFVKTDCPTTFDFLASRSQISGAMKRILYAASASAPLSSLSGVSTVTCVAVMSTAMLFLSILR